ncbi:DUF5667 domain-containing protein, partial [Chloroflexota bacterium]
LTTSNLGKAELYVKLAEKRVTEIINMAEKGKADKLAQTTGRLNEQMIAMASLEYPDSGKAEGPAMMIMQAPAAETAPTAESSALPAEEAPLLSQAPAMAPAPMAPEAILGDATAPELSALEAAPAPTPRPGNRAGSPQQETKIGTVDNGQANATRGNGVRAEIRVVIVPGVVGQINRLRNEFETASPEARPALEAAIAALEAGYLEVLASLE